MALHNGMEYIVLGFIYIQFKVVIMLKAMGFLNLSTKNSNRERENYLRSADAILSVITEKSVLFYHVWLSMSFISNWKQKFIDGSASYHCKVIFAPRV